MKRLLAILMLVVWHAQGTAPYEFSVSLPPTMGPVPPLSSITFDLVVRGADYVAATVNGTPLGEIFHPYTINFTSVSSGMNTIVVIAANDRGEMATNNLTISTLSTVRLLPRRLYR